MTDAELGAELCPDDPAEGERLVAGMTPDKRASYDALVQAARDVDLWQAGVGERPKGVIMCKERGTRGRFRQV